jgi:hypothetical protein
MRGAKFGGWRWFHFISSLRGTSGTQEDVSTDGQDIFLALVLPLLCLSSSESALPFPLGVLIFDLQTPEIQMRMCVWVDGASFFLIRLLLLLL